MNLLRVLVSAITLTAVASACSPSRTASPPEDPVEANVSTTSVEPVAPVAAPTTPSAVPASTATAPAPAKTTDGQFDIGTAYSGTCMVAWPTAPVVTSTAIQMTMSCSGIPSEYSLVLVVYGDPSLEVTPNTGKMTVTGSVQDFAQSQLGMTTPVILADTITIP